MMAFDKASGTLRWQSGTEKAGYCSAIACTLCGTRVILTQNALKLTAHDPATGSILFQHPWGSDKMPKCSQPVVIDEQHLFVSAGYQMGCEMLELSRDASSNQWSVKTLWANKKMKTQFNSVTRSGDCLYGLDDGSMACIDITTGQRLWKEGRYGSGQHLQLGTDQALIQSERGPVFLAQMQRTGYKELATLPALNSKTWNYPTLAGNHLLLRNDREAVCYELVK
jgi:outer membrane protein assembly factor BamB